MTNLEFMEVLKIQERFVTEAMKQAEIMGKAACALVRVQDEMQGQTIIKRYFNTWDF